MNRSNFGAVRLPLLGAAVLASFAVSLSAQVVEKGRTYADLVATHPCDSGSSGRLARVTDAQSSSSIGGGGGSTQVWAVCDGVSTWTLTSIGSAGGGSATAVTGSATLPATCTEKDLYQDTDSGGTEFYVCTATNTWTKTGTGTGDVVGPASATDNAFVRFDATTGKLVQTSNLTCSDVSGVTTTLATITPAATTGAAVAGQSLAITASPAVASTDTAGAAAGGSVTITAGAAARNTSGNANGGDISLITGVGIGSGTAGKLKINSAVELNTGSTPTLKIFDAELNLASNGLLSWGSQVNTFVSSIVDTAIKRQAAGVIACSDASSGRRCLLGGGTAVASATAMPLPTGGVVHVTGTTTITSITSTNFQSGVCITLIFDDALTFTDGSNLKLAGDFVTTADDTLSLCYDGTNWLETSRSIN